MDMTSAQVFRAVCQAHNRGDSTAEIAARFKLSTFVVLRMVSAHITGRDSIDEEIDLETIQDVGLLRRFAEEMAEALCLDPTCITRGDIIERRVQFEMLYTRDEASQFN